MSRILVDPPLTAEPGPEGARSRGPFDRLRSAALTDRFWGWAGPLLVTLVGGVLRFWHLEQPRKIMFDETYYAKEAASYLLFGYERNLRTDLSTDPKKLNDAADKLWNSGQLTFYGDGPDRVVHPMVGKWMIAFGEHLFGPTNPVGWRFSVALAGTIAILMLGRIAYRLFGSALLATTAALLLCVEGLEFVHSRIAILDIFVMFWALAAFGCLLIDRDAHRARLERRLAAATVRSDGGPPSALGPWGGVRPWRLAAVVCLALCTGVKWSGLYFAAAFLVLSVLWDLGTRRALGVPRWTLSGLLDGLQAFVMTVVVLPAVYVATWASWFLTDGGWNRHWADDNPAAAGWGWVPGPLRSLWHYHMESYQFHVTLTTPHDWQANPWAWMVQGRPTLYLFDTWSSGAENCDLTTCKQVVTALGNPVIWWAGIVAALVVLFRWVLARDWRAGAALIGIVGGYLPWFQYQQRTIFEFYAVAFAPWVVLCLVYCLGLILGPPGLPLERRRPRALLAGSYVFLAVMTFWFFYPVLSADMLAPGAVQMRHWLPSWW